MKSKVKKDINKNKYTKLQRKTFILSVAIMLAYLILVCFIMPRAFWTFGTIHTVLAIGAIVFIWLGRAPKIVTYIALFLSSVGAGIALALMLYYFVIFSSFANGYTF